MQLSLEDVELFFRLHRGLMFFVNQRLKVIDKKVATPGEILGTAPGDPAQGPQALLDHMDLIDAFADENPFEFSDGDLEIVRSWKHLVSGTFYVFRYLKTHTIFLTDKEPVVAYGVLALFDPFEAVIGPHLPRMVKTTLLPFKGKIVYDGLVSGYNVTFGGGIKRRLNESYKEAKERYGIITSLPMMQGTAAKTDRTPKGKASGKKPKAKGTEPRPRAAVQGQAEGRSGGPLSPRRSLADHLDGDVGPELRRCRGRGVRPVRRGRLGRVPLRLRPRPPELSRDRAQRQARRRLHVRGERRDGPVLGAGLGLSEGRPDRRQDRLPRRRRVEVQGGNDIG